MKSSRNVTSTENWPSPVKVIDEKWELSKELNWNIKTDKTFFSNGEKREFRMFQTELTMHSEMTGSFLDEIRDWAQKIWPKFKFHLIVNMFCLVDIYLIVEDYLMKILFLLLKKRHLINTQKNLKKENHIHH